MSSKEVSTFETRRQRDWTEDADAMTGTLPTTVCERVRGLITTHQVALCSLWSADAQACLRTTTVKCYRQLHRLLIADLKEDDALLSQFADKKPKDVFASLEIALDHIRVQVASYLDANPEVREAHLTNHVEARNAGRKLHARWKAQRTAAAEAARMAAAQAEDIKEDNTPQPVDRRIGRRVRLRQQEDAGVDRVRPKKRQRRLPARSARGSTDDEGEKGDEDEGGGAEENAGVAGGGPEEEEGVGEVAEGLGRGAEEGHEAGGAEEGKRAGGGDGDGKEAAPPSGRNVALGSTHSDTKVSKWLEDAQIDCAMVFDRLTDLSSAVAASKHPSHALRTFVLGDACALPDFVRAFVIQMLATFTLCGAPVEAADRFLFDFVLCHFLCSSYAFDFDYSMEYVPTLPRRFHFDSGFRPLPSAYPEVDDSKVSFTQYGARLCDPKRLFELQYTPGKGFGLFARVDIHAQIVLTLFDGLVSSETFLHACRFPADGRGDPSLLPRRRLTGRLSHVQSFGTKNSPAFAGLDGRFVAPLSTCFAGSFFNCAPNERAANVVAEPFTTSLSRRCLRFKTKATVTAGTELLYQYYNSCVEFGAPDTLATYDLLFPATASSSSSSSSSRRSLTPRETLAELRALWPSPEP